MNKGTVEKGKTGGISKQNRFNSIIAAILIGFGVGGLTSCDLEIPNNNNTKDSMEQSLFTIDPTIKTNFENAINLGNNKQKNFSFNIDANKTHGTGPKKSTLLDMDINLKPNFEGINYVTFSDSTKVHEVISKETEQQTEENKKKTEKVENHEKLIRIYKNILEDFIKTNGGNILKFDEMKDNTQIKLHIDKDLDGDVDYKQTYKLINDKKNVCLYADVTMDRDYTIHIHREGRRYIVTSDRYEYRNKKYVYDEYGNRITYFDQIRENEARFLSFLQKIKGIKEDDKPMFAAILSSMQLTEVDYKEKEGYLKIFGEDNEAAYEFMIAPSKNKNGGYWGIISKMGKSAKFQTAETDGSSEIYAFTINDESTETKRFKFSFLRVVQDLDGNVQKKFGETSNTKRDETSKGDFWISGVGFSTQSGTHFGVANGDFMMQKGEKIFSKTFESELGEPVLYTLKNGGILELNGRCAYQSPDKFQPYYLRENKNTPLNNKTSK